MKATIKRTTVCMGLLILAAFFAFIIMSVQPTVAFAASGDEIAYDYEYTPVESVELAPENDATTVKPGQTLRLGVNLTPWYAARTVKAVAYEVTEGVAYASVDGSGNLTVSLTAPIGGLIKVIATADDAISPEYSFTVVKIAVTSIAISASASTIVEGGTLTLSSEVLPTTASYKALSFEVLSGTEYASIDSTGKITVSDSILNRSAVFSVQATGDDNIKSNVLAFSIYVPTKSLSMVADNYIPYSTLSSGTSVNLSTTVSQYATLNSPTFTVVSGAEYIESITNNVLTVKSNIQVQNAKISLFAVQDGIYSNEVVLNIYMPVTAITISAGINTINEGESLQIMASHTPIYAGGAEYTYEIISGNNYGSVDNSGLITINDSILNSNASISVRASRDGIYSNTLIFAIYVPTQSLTLSTNKITLNSTSSIGEAATLSTVVSQYASVNNPSFEVISGDEFIQSLTSGVLTVKSNIQTPNAQIKLRTEQDGIYSNEVVISIYVPATNITIFASDNTINRGRTLPVSDSIFPTYASQSNLVYSIVSGGQYADIDAVTGLITVKNTVAVSDATFSVTATRDGIDSNILIFNIYVPATNIELSSNKTTLISSLTSGDVATVTANVDAGASSQPIFTITAGNEFVTSFIDGILMIKQGITALNAYVDIKATCDDATANIRINIERVRVNGVSFTAPTTLNEGATYQLSAPSIVPTNAVIQTYKFSITLGSTYASITDEGYITVAQNLPIPNAKIKVKVTSDGFDSVEKEISLTVPVKSLSISANKTSLSSSSTSGESATFTPAFNSGYSSAPSSTAIIYYVENAAYIDSSVISSGTTLLSNVVKVKTGTPSGTQIKVYAVSGGNTSASITITITVPVETLSVASSASTIASYSASANCGSVSFTPTFNSGKQAPTNTAITYYVRDITNVDSSSLNGTTLKSNTLKVKPGVANGSKILVYAVSGGVTSADVTITVTVPVESISLTASANTVASFAASANCASIIFTPTINSGLKAPTNTTITYYVESAAYIDASSILSGTTLKTNSIKVKPGVANGTQIKVYAISDGKTSASETITVTVPVETLSVVSSTSTIASYSASANCGSVSFTPTFNSGLQSPTNSNITYYVENATYVDASSISNGTTLNGNSIKVKAGVSNGTTIRVYAVSAGITSASVTITVTVPVEKVSIASSTAQLTSTSSSGDSLTITPTFNSGLQAPTSSAITYYVSEGLTYVDTSVILSSNILKSNTLKVKSGVTVPNGAIKVYAVASGVTSEPVTISIYVPVQSLTFGETALSRGATTTLTPTYNSNNSTPTYKAWGVVSISPSTVTIDATNNTIILPSNVTYGTSITLKYKAKDASGNLYGSELTKTFSVKAFTASDFSVSFSNEYWYENSVKKTGYSLSTTAPQLETGHSVDLTAYYGTSASIATYGLTAAIYSSTTTYSTFSGLALSVKSDASGSGTISCVIRITDGSTYYSITKSIAVFRRMTGQPSISQTVIINKTTTLIKLSGTITANGTPTGYSATNLQFVAQDGANYSIMEAGVLTIKTTSVNPSVQLTMTQSYNGNNIVYTSNAISVPLKTYSIYKYDGTTSGPDSVTVVNDVTGSLAKPVRAGYTFGGYYISSSSTLLWNSSGTRTSNTFSSSYSTLYPVWTRDTFTFRVDLHYDDTYHFDYINTTLNTYQSYTYTAPSIDGYSFECWKNYLDGDSVYSTSSTITVYKTDKSYLNLDAWYTKNSCVATGTQITLADGSQKAVEDLDGTELLLVWNLWTGKFDYAPLIFVDSEATAINTVINLYFSDGTSVKVITEHGFWDYDLNKYVFLREDAAQYIGHYFAKEGLIDGERVLQKVRLTDVVITEETTGVWSPVTFGHLCYFVNGMLSMPGATESFINIFDVNPSTMQYDEVQMRLDILTYGLFTYDDFADFLPYEMYEAFGGAYLKISIGKGNTTLEEIYSLIEYYAKFLNAENIGE
jgi:hypothetical protein